MYEIGSNHEEGEEEEEFEPDPEVEDPEEGFEESTYHIKDLRELKLPSLPTSAAGYRAWKNSVLTQFASIDKSGAARILRWLKAALNPDVTDRQLAMFQDSSEGLPRLDSWFAAQVADTKHLKGEFGVSAQAYVERAHSLGILPSGRALLAMLSRRFRVDKVRGATVSQQTLLAIPLEGYSQQNLQTFREHVKFCLNGFAPKSWPSEFTMFSWLYAKLKHCRLLSRAIDKVKDAKAGSTKRTFSWLWTQLVELLDELREGANEASIRDALIKPKVKGTPAPKKDDVPKSEPPTPANPAPPSKPKKEGNGAKGKEGKGKGDNKGKGKAGNPKQPSGKPKAPGGGKGKDTKGEGKGNGKTQTPKATVPCLFFPKGTCNRGENCPFSHEVSNTKAPATKAQGASAAAKSSAAAVALMLPTTAQGSSVAGTSATPSSTSFWKRSGISSFFHTLAGWFTVLSSVCSPAVPATTTSLLVASQHQQPQEGWFFHEWIADSGTGRALESRDALVEQGIPEEAFTNMTEHSSTISFSTGNGVVDSDLMLGVEGSSFGHNAAYLLDSCPSVKSLGELVETKSMPFVWIPGKLPMFLPECAHVQVIEDNAIYADRVEGNVPIFREQVRFVAPSSVAMPGFMSDARKAKPIPRIPAYIPSPHITDESTLLDLMQDPGLPSESASGSRDPDPTSSSTPKAKVKASPPIKKSAAPKVLLKAKAPAEVPSEVVPSADPPFPPPALPPDSDEDDVPTTEKQKELIRQASSIEHRLTHMPKNPFCEVCQRSRMYRQRVTKKRVDPLADRGGLPPATQFGERIAADYIIPSKKDPAVHVIRDEYSGAMRVFVGNRTADKAAQNFLTFVGARYKHLPSVLRKSDDAKELVAAITQIGWVHEGSLENRFPHNSQLEREIRALEESTRALHLAAGFHAVADLWPVSVQLAARLSQPSHGRQVKSQGLSLPQVPCLMVQSSS